MPSLYDRAAIIAGRSLTRSKAVFGRFAAGGNGCMVIDEAGMARIDMLCALGAVSLGYEQAPSIGGVLSYPHRLEVQAAELVLEHVAPWASSIRFLMTGSEATHAALRIAQKATGRKRALMGDWAYHGQQSWSSDLDYPWTTRFAHGGNLAEDFAGREDIAAVFIEPHRWEPIDVDWLREVQQFCNQSGALLVFDEIIYGGRWSLGGASHRYGITPDLACFSKALWNGQAGSCIVGNAALATHGEMISGTFSGSPASLAAVTRTVRAYVDRPIVQTLWRRGQQLANGLEAVIPPHIGIREGAPVHQRIHWHDPDHGVQFMHAMASRGVIFHPLCVNVMAAHTAEDIDRVVEAAMESVKEMA
jgi:glutamate-1-semialdehyde 2,1-aminomutase